MEDSEMFSGWRAVIGMLSEGNVVGVLVYILSVMLAVFVAISFHECAHAYVAYKLGDPTAKNLGRVSLDPMKHLDPVGALLFLLFGFGWAKPVIVNPRNLKNYRRDDVLISLAGPLTNLVLSFIFYGIWFFVRRVTANEIILTVLIYLVSINLSFAIFNILPIPPLDGFHVVSSLLPAKAYKVVSFLTRYGRYILIGLLITGVLSDIMTARWIRVEWLFFSFYSLFI